MENNILETIALSFKLNNAQPKKIKITSECAYYIEKIMPMPYKCEPLDGYYGKFIGIPLELDDTIENEYYELVEELK